jgi:hypothetical protein
VIYCVVPRELAAELLEPLQEHYRAQPRVTVIVDRRDAGRRPVTGGERASSPDGDRRRPMLPRQLHGDLPAELAGRATSVRWMQRLGPVRRGLERVDLDGLTNRIMDGHEDALTEVYWRYVSRVSARVARRLRDPQQVEEATREAFGRAFDELGAARTADRPLEAFLDVAIEAVLRRRGPAERHGAPSPSPRPGVRGNSHARACGAVVSSDEPHGRITAGRPAVRGSLEP